jgi:asparagine synthase (glutamine-hydrolysing)
MCGIVGVLRFDGAPVEPDLVRAMGRQLAHRGPDGEGHWCDGNVGFGHRRLSIIDPAGSHQPMASADGRLHLTFNGEILNYRALRRSLHSYPFRTQGDTEVLLALFADQGPAGVTSLDGQFAYAVFDENDRRLWLFRDRLGILPLYYYADQHLVAFASEVKALLPVRQQGFDVDERSLYAYLGHRSVPAPHTLFDGVHKVPPGHLVGIDERGRIDITRYWSIPSVSAAPPIEPKEAVAKFRAGLDAAVQRNLVADVPVGAYLSGGVDSSLIVATMSRLSPSVVQTFSAGFGDPRFDELPHARTVSRLLGTEHNEVMVGPTEFEERWRDLTWHRDAPLSEPADVAVYCLAREARRSVKVVLSGEGSDELFGGYPKHRYATMTSASGWVPAGLRRQVLGRAERHLPARSRRLRIGMRALTPENEAGRFAGWFAPFTDDERSALLGRRDLRRVSTDARVGRDGDALRRMLAADCGTWLADNLLERGDRMTMAASVELRPPFLDHQLVELAFSLPSNVKVRGGTTKWVVKEAARQVLPASIVDRSKLGFRVPLDAWFRSGLREMAWDRLLGRDSFVADVMDRHRIRSLLTSHDHGRRNEDIRIWTLLCLEVWHESFFRQPPSRQLTTTHRTESLA